jgi:Glycosyl hydrolase family 62
MRSIDTAAVHLSRSIFLAVAVVQLACGASGPSAVAQPPLVVPALWEYSAPLIAPESRDENRSRAQKDPTVVQHEGRWHVFMTVKLPTGTAIEYASFARWEDANAAPRTILRVADGYYAAPQVFYFAPHAMWYLIYQVGAPGSDKMWVAYSTTRDIADPASWTRARPALDGSAEDPRPEGGLDYWIICDEERAYLFFTSLNGKLWRMWTRLEEFPHGFRDPQIALRAEIFEASHTYALAGIGGYLTIIEQNGQRYYKAYLADRLDGAWTPLADSEEAPFAGWRNIRPARGVAPWTDNVSHGELIRAGVDQRLQIDPERLRFVFQGVLESEKTGKGYGGFPWRIGILTPVTATEGTPAAP